MVQEVLDKYLKKKLEQGVWSDEFWIIINSEWNPSEYKFFKFCLVPLRFIKIKKELCKSSLKL